MSCLSDETLRTLIDHEATGPERTEADRHLEDCPQCRTRLQQMSQESLEAENALASLAPDKAIDPPLAYQKFRARLASEDDGQSRHGFLKGIFSAHPLSAWGSLATAALILVLVVFAPARSWTQRVLSMLRVEKVAVVPVDLNFSPNSDTQALVRQVISNEVTVTLSPGKPQSVSNASQASQLAGFTVRTFTDLSETPKIGVMGEQSYLMKLDQSRLQAILDNLGRQNLQVPESVNGQTIAVHIPKSVFLRYGNCPDRRTESKAGEQSQTAPQDISGCVMFGQVPSPIVSVPPELDVSQLFQIALQAAGMSPAQAQQFCSTVDWKSTLVVPIPRQASSYIPEQVDGVQGNLIMGKSFRGRPAEYTLIWVKNGIIYSLRGYGSADQALALAGSLS
jgi:anti-sigma factor RsiW